MSEGRSDIVLVSAGSNKGQPLLNCTRAVQRLRFNPDISVRAVSSLYLTEPVSDIDQSWFYNFAVKLETVSSPHELLAYCQTIEQELGRERHLPDSPRTIDLDIAYFGKQIIRDKDLTVPHPRLIDRKFVLVPLAEIAPEFIDPLHNKSILKLLRQTRDRHAVLLYGKNWLNTMPECVEPDHTSTGTAGVIRS